MKQILIADDHAVTRRGLREILQDEFKPIHIGEATDSHEALERVREQPWDLILLDIIMPGMSVMEVLEKIREERPEVPVLILTAVAETEYAVRTIKAGANGYINKQHAADDLITAVRKVMDGETYLSDAAIREMTATLRGDAAAQLPHQTLSPRELEVFLLIAQGKTVKEASGDLGVSDKTVSTYLARIKEKTGLISYVEIARYAMQHNLVD